MRKRDEGDCASAPAAPRRGYDSESRVHPFSALGTPGREPETQSEGEPRLALALRFGLTQGGVRKKTGVYPPTRELLRQRAAQQLDVAHPDRAAAFDPHVQLDAVGAVGYR